MTFPTATCTVRLAKICPIDAAKCCPITNTFVQSLMLSDSDNLEPYVVNGNVLGHDVSCSIGREAPENGEPTAHRLYKFMVCYKFVAITFWLSDVLPHLSRLSKIFRNIDVDLSLIQPCLQTTIDTISKYKDTAQPNLSSVDSFLSTELKDFTIEATIAQKEAFKSGIR